MNLCWFMHLHQSMIMITNKLSLLFLTLWNTRPISSKCIKFWCHYFLNHYTSLWIKIFFRLFELVPSTIHCKDNNKGIHYQLSTTYVWMKTHDVDCIFIIQKGDEYNNRNQILAFVDDQFIDVNCHPPTNCIHYKRSQ
jgi:hypothetical protein